MPGLKINTPGEAVFLLGMLIRIFQGFFGKATPGLKVLPRILLLPIPSSYLLFLTPISHLNKPLLGSPHLPPPPPDKKVSQDKEWFKGK